MDVREKTSNGKRLIDADALMDVIRQHEYRLATKQGSIDYGMFTLGIQQAVDEQPTIDAAPVIRCRECSKWQKKYTTWLCRGFGYCTECMMGCHADNYCSYGERKEGAD